MAKDIQRARVYRWEDTMPLQVVGISSERRCGMKKCRTLISEACRIYNLPLVHVRLPKNIKQNYAAFYDGENLIVLPRAFQRQTIALHEAAHYITRIYWPKTTDHGEAFVRVYMHLLHEVLGVDMDWLEKWARFHRVTFATHRIYTPGMKQFSEKNHRAYLGL